MEQTVTVIALEPGDVALVEHLRPSACSGDCHRCAGCGAVQQTMRLRANNPIGAQVGDWVKLHSSSRVVLKAAFVVYFLPLVLFFLGYGLGSALGFFPAALACLGFALGVAVIVIYNRRVSRSGEVTYTIVGYADGASHERKKENLEC